MHSISSTRNFTIGELDYARASSEEVSDKAILAGMKNNPDEIFKEIVQGNVPLSTLLIKYSAGIRTRVRVKQIVNPWKDLPEEL